MQHRAMPHVVEKEKYLFNGEVGPIPMWLLQTIEVL